MGGVQLLRLLFFIKREKSVKTAQKKQTVPYSFELFERYGLIIRTVYPVVPPKVEYSLSDFGKTIIPVLKSMCSWGEDYLSSINMKTCCSESNINQIAGE